MKYILFAIAITAATLLHAQQPFIPGQPTSSAPTLLIADDSSTGTYKQFLKEISGFTSGVINFVETPPDHGAVGNLEQLVNNQAQAAFLHSDVIVFRSRTKDLSKFKTLLALFSEEVHFVAKTDSGKKVGGAWGIGGKTLELRDISDLNDTTKVGAAGGGYITAQVIKFQTQLGYEAVKYDKGADVIAALNRGEIDAGVFVGGAPVPTIDKLGPEYKILPIPDRLVDNLKSVYHPATVTYTSMRPEGVRTVAADALLVAREYKTPKFIAALKAFRETFNAHLEELQETPGTHPKWSEVDPDNHGTWPWMELK